MPLVSDRDAAAVWMTMLGCLVGFRLSLRAGPCGLFVAVFVYGSPRCVVICLAEPTSRGLSGDSECLETRPRISERGVCLMIGSLFGRSVSNATVAAGGVDALQSLSEGSQTGSARGEGVGMRLGL